MQSWLEMLPGGVSFLLGMAKMGDWVLVLFLRNEGMKSW